MLDDANEDIFLERGPYTWKGLAHMGKEVANAIHIKNRFEVRHAWRHWIMSQAVKVPFRLKVFRQCAACSSMSWEKIATATETTTNQ